MAVTCFCLSPLRRRSALAIAIAAVAIAVLASHDLPVVGHGVGGHDGIGVGEMAAVCLAVTATVATTAAGLSRPTSWTRTGSQLRWAGGLAPTRRDREAAARAGPPVSAVLRL